MQRIALMLGLIAYPACDAERRPDATVQATGSDPVDRDASAADLYFELVRLHSLGLVSAERMNGLQVVLDDVELAASGSDRIREEREAIAAVLRCSLRELKETDPELTDGLEAREYARRLHRRGVVVSQDLSEATLVIAGLVGVPTSKGELALVLALPAGGHLVAKVANVAFKRALLALRKARSLDHLLLESERFGLQLRIAHSSTELASTISGRPVDEALLARIKAAFERQGGQIVQNADVDRYLRMRGAEAVTDNAKQFLLTSRPSTSAVFEELIHTAQHRTGKFNALVEQLGHKEAERLLEIEAGEKLVRNAKAWGIPEEETRQTAERLARLKAKGGR